MSIKVLCEGPCLEIAGIKYHHHPNGGGLVAETAEVAETVFICLDSIIHDRGKVLGEAKVLGGAKISGEAQISGQAHIDGAEISGNAKVSDTSKVIGNIQIAGKVEIAGDSSLIMTSGGPYRIDGEQKFHNYYWSIPQPEIVPLSEY